MQETVKRFYPSIICSIILFLISITSHYPKSSAPMGLTVILAVYGYFWFGAARLIAEGRNWNEKKFLFFSIAGLALLAFIVLAASVIELEHDFIMPSLLLLIMAAPFLNAEKDDAAFWNHNCRVWIGVTRALVAPLILWLGLVAAVWSTSYLFEIRTVGVIDVYAFFFCAFLFGPVYALAWVPLPTQSKEDVGYPQSCKFLVNWILAPLICVYFVILYAYGIKTILEWELPRGGLAAMVCGFASVGIVTYLLAWPIRDTGSKLVRVVHRNFFKILAFPVVLLFLAIIFRIRDYGVTEDRYTVLVFGVWLSTLMILFGFRQTTPLKTIPASLAMVLFLSSFGPWGAVSLSIHSQQARLAAILEKNNILINGRIVPAEKDIPFEEEKQISDIITYFVKNKQGDKLPNALKQIPWDKKWNRTEKIMEAMNLK